MLSSLPSTRPQRPSARRAAARRIAVARAERAVEIEPTRTAKADAKQAEKTQARQATKTPPKQTTKTPPKQTTKTPPKQTTKSHLKQAEKTRPGQTRRTPLEPVESPVPRQGFEAEEEIPQGRSVQPPSGTELAGSVAELFGELAQAGLSTGGRLLKDALTRLSSG